MISYEFIKTIHIILATFFFGGGAVSAFFKLRSLKNKDLPTLLFIHKTIVAADYVFTIPAVIGLPISGLWLANLIGMDFATPWIQRVFFLYALAGIPWVPAALLQVKMKKLLQNALEKKIDVDPLYYRYSVIWMILGVPSFLASLTIIYTMVNKEF